MDPKKKFEKVSDEFASSVESCYTPIVQSGGSYDLPKLYACRYAVQTIVL